MKFTLKDRSFIKRSWHDWFAWHPIIMKRSNGEIKMVWLMKVSRLGEEWHATSARGWSYAYKEIVK